jgi:predicted GNAT family N-acyltransferase
MMLTTPVVLTDSSRLQEIYDLRVVAWEGSARSNSINLTKFPNGWSEEIDKNATHFVIIDQHDKIVASARISLHYDITELPYPSVFKDFILPINRPFAFYSRLVVAPEYRNNLFLKQLDLCRLRFLKENNIAFAIATCKQQRMKSLIQIGFEVLGTTNVDFAEIGEETAMLLLLENIKIEGSNG